MRGADATEASDVVINIGVMLMSFMWMVLVNSLHNLVG